MIYEVEEDGELIELTNPPRELPENAAIIFVSRESKKIYIWLGPKAGIKKKFILAREGSKKRLEYSYPIVHVQNDGKEEEFSRDYLMYVTGGLSGAPPAEKKPVNQKTVQSKPRPEPKKEVRQESTNDFADLNIPVADEENVKIVSTSASKVPKPNLPINTSVSIPKDVDTSSIEKIIEAIRNVPIIEGHVRDYLIVNGKVGILDENVNPPTYKIINDVPTGIFEVQDLKPRVLIKNGTVMAIELWRKY